VSARSILRTARRRLHRYGAYLDDAVRASLVEQADALERSLHEGSTRESREAAQRLVDGVGRHLPRRAIEVVREWLIIILISFVIAFAMKDSLIEPYVVPTRSMFPTLRVDDRIVVSKCAYDVWLPFAEMRLARVRDPKRWEVIVFTTRDIPDASAAPRDFVKRVVGLPGEVIELRDGEIYANGVLVEKPPSLAESCYYVNTPDGRTSMQALDDGSGDAREVVWRYGMIGQCFAVPEGHYFVLGDNSIESLDGRCWGFVSREAVRGRVMARWRLHWPFYGGPVR